MLGRDMLGFDRSLNPWLDIEDDFVANPDLEVVKSFDEDDDFDVSQLDEESNYTVAD